MRVLEDGHWWFRGKRLLVASILARPGLVVLSDTFYPGWSARVDGMPVPIVATNHLFRSVPAPAGRHRIRFEYRPANLRIGASASILGWLLIGSACIALVRQRPTASSRIPYVVGSKPSR